MSIRIRKLSYALGAEICGVDITKPSTDEAFGAIHRARFFSTACFCFVASL